MFFINSYLTIKSNNYISVFWYLLTTCLSESKTSGSLSYCKGKSSPFSLHNLAATLIHFLQIQILLP
jgi:hypothetical protein